MILLAGYSPSQEASCALYLLPAYRLRCVDDLTMQIGQLYFISVDKAYRSDTSTSHVSCCRAAQSASPNDENLCMLELELTWNMPMSLNRELRYHGQA